MCLCVNDERTVWNFSGEPFILAHEQNNNKKMHKGG